MILVCSFDLNNHGVTDVIGVLEKKEQVNYYKNKDGVDTIDIRFKITDGRWLSPLKVPFSLLHYIDCFVFRNGLIHVLPSRKKINVTFWGSFAEEFGNALDEVKEEIIIVIIASAKVKAWQGISFPLV